jgi:hypothetical protein
VVYFHVKLILFFPHSCLGGGSGATLGCWVAWAARSADGLLGGERGGDMGVMEQ